jgi:dinuclear metal center YbgI/SA1388 family protein
MKLREITDYIESIVPLSLQESYDNSGLIIGRKDNEINRALLCVDITEDVIDEAVKKECELIISHHPLIFGNGLKKLNGENEQEKIIIRVIKNDISIYAAHTNLDNYQNGVNKILCDKLGIINTKVISPKSGLLRKLVTFCPVDKANEVRGAIFEAGAGYIGNYDCCSFNVEGSGSFRANEGANPYVGEKGKLHYEKEVRIETIYPVFLEGKIIKAMLESHPYEEVAYDIYPLGNKWNNAGLGLLGELAKGKEEKVFFKYLKDVTNAGCIRHTKLQGKKINKVAVCTGAGSFLIKEAINAGADVFITADMKYHQFFEAENKIIIADIGHYESEQFAKELLYTLLNQKFPKFAPLISDTYTNPVYYL